MSIAKKCDRCGKLYEEYNAKPNEYKVNGFCLVTIRTEYSTYKHPWQDLCKDCMSELICWFLNPRFEGRNLTDEEAKIYDEWVNSESVKTGESLLEEGTDKITNGDRIRKMTDEELARFLDIASGCSVCFLDITAGECTGFRSSMDCIANKMKWLKQEVSEDAGSKTDRRECSSR